MYLAIRARRLTVALAAAILVSAAAPLAAQEFSESHIKAARAAINAVGATEEFDMVLPQAAAALKAEFIQRSPDLVQLISSTVDEKTLALASRRADLEREVASIYARLFTEQELNEITAFYGSPTGKKLLSDGEIVAREVTQAAQIWQRGIARDLAQTVGDHLTSVTGAQAQQPAEGPQVNQ